MQLTDFFKNGNVYIWEASYAVVKSKKVYPDAFVNIVDKNEITVIIDPSKLNSADVIEIENGWKIFTFDMILPFELVGFLAKVSSVLAEKGISIFAISAYSTDHILVKEKDSKETKLIFKSLGFRIEEM